MVKFERHHNRTDEQTCIMIYYFICMFCNTNLIIIVISADFKGLIESFPNSGTFSEFSYDWYE